jgi:hypothetical protein
VPKKGTMWIKDAVSIIITSKNIPLFKTVYFHHGSGTYVDVYQTQHGSIVEITVE